MRLLIVEDEKQICDMVAKSLYAAGYEVDTCYDGKEALECILSESRRLSRIAGCSRQLGLAHKFQQAEKVGGKRDAILYHPGV